MSNLINHIAVLNTEQMHAAIFPAVSSCVDVNCMNDKMLKVHTLACIHAVKRIYTITGFVLTKPSWDWDLVNYSRPGRVWKVTSLLGTGIPLNLFLHCRYCSLGDTRMRANDCKPVWREMVFNFSIDF